LISKAKDTIESGGLGLYKREIYKPVPKKPVFTLPVKWKLVFESSLWVEMLQPIHHSHRLIITGLLIHMEIDTPVF
jgi:hypothetical protein